MKKLFALLTITGFLSFGMLNTVYAQYETATEEAAPTAASSGGTGRVIPTRRRSGGLVVLSDLGGGRDPLRPMEVTHVDAHLDLVEFSVIYQSANFNWIVPSETH